MTPECDHEKVESKGALSKSLALQGETWHHQGSLVNDYSASFCSGGEGMKE